MEKQGIGTTERVNDVDTVNASQEFRLVDVLSSRLNSSNFADARVVKNTIFLLDYFYDGHMDFADKNDSVNSETNTYVSPVQTVTTLNTNDEVNKIHTTYMDVSTIGLCVLLGSIILVTIIGNMLVIAAIATTRRLRTVTNFFVMSLAVSDLLVGFLVMPLAVVHEISQAWLLGKIACELWISMDVMLCTASILNLCCISVDRYFAITSPMAYVVKRSRRLALVMIAAVWVASALITCPPMFGWHEGNRDNTTDCGYNTNQGYVVYSALGSFYIPAIVIVYVYCRIFAAARRRQEVLCEGDAKETQAEDPYKQSVPAVTGGTCSGQNRVLLTCEQTEKNKNLVTPLNDISSPNLLELVCRYSPKNLHVKTPLKHTNSDPQCSCDTGANEEAEKQKKGQVRGGWRTSTWREGSVYHRRKYQAAPTGEIKRAASTTQKRNYERAAFQRERRLAKSLSVVVGGFFVCWLPFFITYLLEPFCTSCYFHPTLQSSLVWLGWVNSGINPFIYAFNSLDFRKAFVRLTIGRCRRRRSLRRHNPQNFL